MLKLCRARLFCLSAVVLLTAKLPAQGQADTNTAPSTRRMADLVQKRWKETDPLDGPVYCREAERAQGYRLLLDQATNLLDRINLRYLLAQNLFNSGQFEEGLSGFNAVGEFFQQNPALTTSKNLAVLRFNQALCYFWQGELQNCWSNHHAESCLFQMKGAAIQKEQVATRKAIEILTNHLAQVPNDLKGLWLLNMAAMSLGEYPDKLPAPLRIDPKVFAPEYDIKRFPDVAPLLGLDVFGLAGGSILEDFDGDGHLDRMVSSWSYKENLRYFHNNGDGTFTERTREAGLLGETCALNMLQTDYNNDGYPDVLLLRGGWMGVAGRLPNSLLRNNGNGTFTDVTEEAGLLSFHPTQTAAWFDYNHDGWLDLFIGNESFGKQVHPCELYRNNGDGTFTECAAQMGLAKVAFVKGVTAGDFNNDGWTDLYLSIRGEENVLYRNDGPAGADKSPKATWKFTDVSHQAKVTEPIYSFPTWFWDYDNDGWLDIFVSDYGTTPVVGVAADYAGLPHSVERARLYHNNHDGTFTDVTKAAHLYKVLYAMGANFGDLDNDGFLDFYLGTGDPELSTVIPNRMFRSAEGKFFQDVTVSGGFGQLHKGHGISFGDIDNDGDQDVAAVMGGAYTGDPYFNALFENPGHSNHWVVLKLQGVKSNRAAIGARIKVVAETAEGGERNIYRTVCTGGSFGANPFRQEIGLGQSKSIRQVEIFWPVTGQTQILKELKMDGFYRVREGDAEAVLWKLPQFKLSGNSRTQSASHSQH